MIWIGIQEKSTEESTPSSDNSLCLQGRLLFQIYTQGGCWRHRPRTTFVTRWHYQFDMCWIEGFMVATYLHVCKRKGKQHLIIRTDDIDGGARAVPISAIAFHVALSSERLLLHTTLQSANRARCRWLFQDNPGSPPSSPLKKK
jgi:hypothetical protein